MPVSGINNYNEVLYKWQGQQLKSTGSTSAQSRAANSVSSLFSGASMTSQLNSMVELTKYAMNAMGVGADSRVTFSQITKYRQQLVSEFNAGVKKGFEESGISDISALSFTVDSKGVITASGANAADRKSAQAWLDANPSLGEDLRKSLSDANVEGDVSFKLSTTGSLILEDATTQSLQNTLDKNKNLTEALRSGLKSAGIDISSSLAFKFSASGALEVDGESENAEAINDWLAKNTELADLVKKELDKKDIDPANVSLRLGREGNMQISVDSVDNENIRKVLADSSDLGKKALSGLQGLGIDPNASFTLQIDASGALVVMSDHPDKDKIQKFFDDNPQLAKKYMQIETLSGIDDARKAMQISPAAMRKRIQIESMAAWWSTSGNANSYFGQYSNGNMSLLSSLNMTI